MHVIVKILLLKAVSNIVRALEFGVNSKEWQKLLKSRNEESVSLILKELLSCFRHKRYVNSVETNERLKGNKWESRLFFCFICAIFPYRVASLAICFCWHSDNSFSC